MPLLSAWVCRFQSTLPLRGATYDYAKLAGKITISIHAPLTGSDCIVDILRGEKDDFNPRSPYGERHGRLYRLPAAPHISIHAPLTGSDKSFKQLVIAISNFNPRSPYGERPPAGGHRRDGRDFNPRSPYGERLYEERSKGTLF